MDAEKAIGIFLDSIQSFTGQTFFRNLVNELSLAFKVDYASIMMIDPVRPHMANTLAVSFRGRIIDNYAYDLRDRPTEAIIKKRFCHFPRRVQLSFPHAPRLSERNIESYMGISLVTNNGKVLGLIAMMHGEEIQNPERAEAILRVVAGRATAELEREVAERALRESRAHLIASQRIGRVGSWELDLVTDQDINANPLRWSDECYRIFGYKPREVEVNNDLFWSHVHPEDRPKIEEAVQKAFENSSVYQVEHRIILRDGTERTINERAELIEDPTTQRAIKFIGTAQDVTEQRHTEQMLRQSQKMQAIGQLAGGVAHDFNNLLTIINSNCELLLLQLGRSDPMVDKLSNIREAGERASLLTRQLLMFSRKAVIEPQVLDINSIIESTGMLLQRLIGEHIALEMHLNRDALFVNIDAVQLEQIVMNLSLNARDAMPQGGRLTIESGQSSFDADFCRAHPDHKPGSYVRLTVTDTGFGISSAVRPHLFEPFFTTKGPGEGTGLGLATVYGIVQGVGGFITVKSSVGSGSTFSIFLPPAEAERSPRQSAERSEDPLYGSETILIVEDEAMVREIINTALTMHGYTVIEAANGAQAIELFERHRGKIDLVITDVVMPNMSGGRLVQQLSALSPGLKVVYMSGYNDDALVRNGIVTDNSAFIQKPFTPSVLAKKIKEVLAARR